MPNPDEIGALWFKEKDGKTYMTGKINGVPVVVFQNTRKTPGSNQPDWNVLKAKGRPEAAPATSDDGIPF